MIDLTPAQRRELKARAHHLQPVVMVGEAGLTPSVLNEVEVALKSHELMKIRILGDDRNTRATLIETICTQLKAASVQHIGKILVIYRPRPDNEPIPASSKARGTKPGIGTAGKAAQRPRHKPGPRRTKRSFQGS